MTDAIKPNAGDEARVHKDVIPLDANELAEFKAWKRERMVEKGGIEADRQPPKYVILIGSVGNGYVRITNGFEECSARIVDERLGKATMIVEVGGALLAAHRASDWSSNLTAEEMELFE